MARFIYQGTFTDGSGVVVGAQTTGNSTDGVVSVYLAGTTTAASVYTASAGGTAVNSVETDDYGHFVFYVDTGDYASTQKFKITLTHADFQSKTYDNIQIFPYSYTHISGDGSDHSFIDQDVTSTSSPTFIGTNFTGIPASAISSTDRSGDETMLVTTSTGHATKNFAYWSTSGDLENSSVASTDLDFALISAGSTGTDITQEELEELTNGSTTVLHSHSAQSISHWTYGAQTSYSSTTTMVLSTGIESSSVTIEVLLDGISANTDDTPIRIQLGHGSTYYETNYIVTAWAAKGDAYGQSDSTFAAQLGVTGYTDAAGEVTGVVRFTRWDSSENRWIITGSGTHTAGTNYQLFTSGVLAAGGPVTSARLMTNSTASYDAGEARVRYQ